jgi:hypothetical protein
MQSIESQQRIACTFRFAPDTVDRLKVAARADLRSVNSAVEVACLAWLAEREAMAAGSGGRRDRS